MRTKREEDFHLKVLAQETLEHLSTFRFSGDVAFKDNNLLPGKLHKDGDCDNDDEVKDGEFVHLLAHTGLPTLRTTRKQA